MDSQPAPQPGFTKPIGGFIVVLAVALFVGGWLYVDMVKNELEMKIESVSSEVKASKTASPVEADETPAPPAEAKTRTYAAALGEHRFQVDLPASHTLAVEGEMGITTYAYIMMKRTPENETPVPDAIITIVSESEMEAMLDEEDPRVRLVPSADGKVGFMIRVWEDFEWPDFERVAASFKAL